MATNDALDARLDEIAGDIARIAPVVRSAIDKALAGEIDLERAASITRSAEVLVDMWTLEADLIRMRRTPKLKRQ